MHPYIIFKRFKLYTEVLNFIQSVTTDCILTETNFIDEVYYNEKTDDYKVIIKI